MSGSQPSAVDQILQNVDLASIQDERARKCIELLLNLVESLTADLRKAQAEILYLKQQLKRGGKGGGGPSGPSKETARPTPRSSEKQRDEPPETSKRGKGSKLDRIRIDREEVLKLDRTALPPDAEFKGYEEVVVQDLRISTDNVRFRKEKYYAASSGKTYLAPLPQGYAGEFGPNLKSLCLLFAHRCNIVDTNRSGMPEHVALPNRPERWLGPREWMG